MNLARVYSRAQVGIQAPEVTVEVHLSGGLPSLSLVGLPEAAVKESKDRVRAAIQTSHYDFPARRITINLAPAELPKDGGRFDLPIAIGILVASGQVPDAALADYEFVGELALSGAVRASRGLLATALAVAPTGRGLICPRANADEAALASAVAVYGAGHLREVCAQLQGEPVLARQAAPRWAVDPPSAAAPDLAEVRGQAHAKRALEVAAAGAHSLLLIGPPGTGKTMLASRLPGILPAMNEAEALESAAVNSLGSGGLCAEHWRRRPFRAPHHTASGVALVGGGSQPRPGEISLAHHGVLFLDELPEFDRRVLEVLREPLEAGRITISRAARQAEFPAQFQLIAAMNPCPCGYLGDSGGRCRCTAQQVRRYRARLSGPLLDRIDLHVEVPRLPRGLLGAAAAAEPSARVRSRVEAARGRQQARAGVVNARLSPALLQRHCALDQAGRDLLEQAVERLGLSPRAYHRVLKVARTVADLEGAPAITVEHVGEALAYRRLDRQATD